MTTCELSLTFLNVCCHRPEEVDNVGMFPQVGHYLQLGHEGLEDVFIGVWVESFDGNCSLRLVFFNSFTFMAHLLQKVFQRNFTKCNSFKDAAICSCPNLFPNCQPVKNTVNGTISPNGYFDFAWEPMWGEASIVSLYFTFYLSIGNSIEVS